MVGAAWSCGAAGGGVRLCLPAFILPTSNYHSPYRDAACMPPSRFPPRTNPLHLHPPRPRAPHSGKHLRTVHLKMIKQQGFSPEDFEVGMDYFEESMKELGAPEVRGASGREGREAGVGRQAEVGRQAGPKAGVCRSLGV